MNQDQRGFRPGSLIFFAAILIFMFIFMRMSGSRTDVIGYEEFASGLKSGEITEITVNQNEETPTGNASAQWKSGRSTITYVSDVNALQQEIRDAGADYTVSDIPRPGLLASILPYLIIGLAMMLFFSFMMRRMGGGPGGQMADFGRSRAKKTTKSEVTFKDVAGLDEEKAELEDIVDFLKKPKKYTDLGARIPKGIILEGPPGTGKTLIAKAVAGEAGVPFFSISGSDFVEMYVGVGASRVRDLFAEAKKNAPCIVFIDEIDAVGRKRGSGLGGSHDEREQTLNQLLVEMDGFGANVGVIVLAATNRVDILDPAILRPGRFDRKVLVGRPDVKGREEILKVHAANKTLGAGVDLHRVAQTTSGFTGADLENLLNEAAIITAKENRSSIEASDIDRAFIKVGIGTEKKSRVMSEKDRKITAYHEAGHAILFHDLPDMDPVHTISIIPTGAGAAGYTMPLPENDDMFSTRGKMLQHIMVCLGGRIAEKLIFDDVTSGASQDIRQATAIARAMVMQYGMSDKLGMVNYGSEGNEIFIGRDFGQTKSYSEHMAELIDEEVKRIIDECYRDATDIIESRRDILEGACRLLLSKEKITGEEFDALYGQAGTAI